MLARLPSRDACCWPGLRPMPHLVTSKTLSRRPLSARATAVSEWPLPYAGAVSTQLTPASIAAWIALTASSISIAPYRSPDIGQVPNPIPEHCSLVRPNRRYCIIRLHWQGQRRGLARPRHTGGTGGSHGRRGYCPQTPDMIVCTLCKTTAPGPWSSPAASDEPEPGTSPRCFGSLFASDIITSKLLPESRP